MINHNLLAALRRSPVWAIDDPARIDAALYAESPRERRAVAQLPPVENGVQVIPIEGVLVPKATWIGDWFGGEVALDGLRAQLRAAVANPDARSMLLVFDSPGGDVTGVPEMAGEIMAARAEKPVAAHVRFLAASGGYWLASQASTITMEPSAEVGSIGVFAMHASFQKALEESGIDVTILREPAAKAEWNPWEKLTDAAKENAQKHVAETYRQFVAAVAAGRGVSAETVRESFGAGRSVTARDAKAAGMVDGIVSMDVAMQRASKARLKADDSAARQRDVDWLTV